MKPAICCRCGKDLKDTVPDDATDITCFACDNRVARDREREIRYRREHLSAIHPKPARKK